MSAHAPKARDGPTVGALARRYGRALLADTALPEHPRRVLAHIATCRTGALGGHLARCAGCGYEHPVYNSCRDRHCPGCQGLARQRWLEARLLRLLPVHHFHVVFTLPSELRALVQRNRRALFALLFRAATDALAELAASPDHLGPAGTRLGVTAVLHTWTRDLSFHPHLHCVVTGGGLAPDGTWIATRPGFLFPVRVLGAVFRRRFVDGLRALRRDDALDEDGLNVGYAIDRAASRRRWVVYCKPPFRDAEKVYAYLGRYTHRIAISNSRILHVDERGLVTFVTRGDGRAQLPAVTFLRRFLLHVLPAGFTRIRHYGLLAPSNVRSKLERARELLLRDAPAAPPTEPPRAEHPDPDAPQYVRDVYALTGRDLLRCPRCRARLAFRRILPVSRGPP